jgi:glycosidase
MKQPKYPTLYQVNTRVWLTEISGGLGRKATLDDIPDSSLDNFLEMGFQWIWFLSVWTTGEQGQKISREYPDWQRDFENTLPDLRKEDIAGSGFAIKEYSVHPVIGGDAALSRLRKRLNERNLKLMLDLFPHHMGRITNDL